MPLIFLSLLIGFTGWAAYPILFSGSAGNAQATPINSGTWIAESFLIYLCGFGMISLILFVLTITGWFHWQGMMMATIILLISSAWVRFKRNVAFGTSTGRYLLFCLLLGISAIGFGKIVRPYQAVLNGNDASVYLAAGLQLARQGEILYRDPLILEMRPEEREVILTNRFAPGDTTGEKVRFPGGVRSLDISKGIVTFSFYHLFPAWLGFGMKLLGAPGLLCVLSLFSMLTIVAVFLIANELAGALTGVSVATTLFVFFPQLYFSQMPVSEILGQTLFLAGLYVLVTGFEHDPVLPLSHQRLVGVLWGALFLCRVDSLFFVPLSLLILFCCFPPLTKRMTAHRTMIVYLIFFALLAFYHQLQTGEYFFLLVWDPALKRIEALNEVLAPTVNYMMNHPIAGSLAFSAMAVAVLCASRFWLLRQNNLQWILFRSTLGVLLIGFSLFATLAGFIRWDAAMKHVQWLNLYIPLSLFCALMGGILLLAWIKRKETDFTIPILLVFLLIPLIFYLFRPLVIERQPWAMRRLVLWVFPLFFCLSFSGWYFLFKGILQRRRFLTTIFFLMMVLLPAGTFFQRSAYLFNEPLFSNVIDQVKVLAKAIPTNSLVIVPDSEASTHIQLAVQYLLNRSTILLPLNKKTEAPYSNTITAYLKRQLKEKRPVIALLSDRSAGYLLQKHFHLMSLARQTVSFREVPMEDKKTFPSGSRTIRIHTNLFGVHEKKTPPVRSEIFFNDPDVTYLKFHQMEAGFRWTTDESEIRDFVFHTEGRDVILVLSTGFEHPVFPMDKLKISVLLNDSIPATFLKREGNDYYFQVDSKQLSSITSVTIRSETFVPGERKINVDGRRLGISFVKLRFLMRADP